MERLLAFEKEKYAGRRTGFVPCGLSEEEWKQEKVKVRVYVLLRAGQRARAVELASKKGLSAEDWAEAEFVANRFS